MEHIEYLAGMIDADGHISMYRRKKNTSQFNFDVGVTNNHMPLILWLIDKFGGSWYTINPKPGKTFSVREHYVWKLRHREMRAILPYLIPYLLVKKERALAVLAMLETAQAHKEVYLGVSEELANKRELIYQKFQSLTIP